jgi:uncharacterized protein (DUF1778 family)
MPTTKKRKRPVRTRPVDLRVMVTEAEKKKIVRAAKKAGQPVTTWLRKGALERALATLNERMAALKKRDGEEG